MFCSFLLCSAAYYCTIKGNLILAIALNAFTKHETVVCGDLPWWTSIAHAVGGWSNTIWQASAPMMSVEEALRTVNDSLGHESQVLELRNRISNKAQTEMSKERREGNVPTAGRLKPLQRSQQFAASNAPDSPSSANPPYTHGPQLRLFMPDLSN
jgi:hypothetical protein